LFVASQRNVPQTRAQVHQAAYRFQCDERAANRVNQLVIRMKLWSDDPMPTFSLKTTQAGTDAKDVHETGTASARTSR
jgi:hypothetical protein